MRRDLGRCFETLETVTPTSIHVVPFFDRDVLQAIQYNGMNCEITGSKLLTHYFQKKREALDIQSAHLLRWWIEDWSRSSDRVTVKSVSRMIRTVDPCIERPRSLAMGELCRLYCALGILGQGFCAFDVNVTFASNKGRSLHNDLNLGRPLSRKAKLALSQLIA